MTTVEADVKFVERHLIATLDKRLTLKVLREWRSEATDPQSANAFADVIDLIDEGFLDG